MSLAVSAPRSAARAASRASCSRRFPADAWLAFAAADVGQQIQASLDQFKAGFQAGLRVVGRPDSNVDPIAEINKATGIDVEKDLGSIGDVGGFVQGTSLLGHRRRARARDRRRAGRFRRRVDKLPMALAEAAGGPGHAERHAASPSRSRALRSAPRSAVEDGKVVARRPAAPRSTTCSSPRRRSTAPTASTPRRTRSATT